MGKFRVRITVKSRPLKKKPQSVPQKKNDAARRTGLVSIINYEFNKMAQLLDCNRSTYFRATGASVKRVNITQNKCLRFSKVKKRHAWGTLKVREVPHPTTLPLTLDIHAFLPANLFTQ